MAGDRRSRVKKEDMTPAYTLLGVLLGILASIPGSMVAAILMDGTYLTERPMWSMVVVLVFVFMVWLIVRELKKIGVFCARNRSKSIDPQRKSRFQE